MTQINYDTIKTNIKAILDAANTTTGSPIDLSLNMNTRVARIMKIDPKRIPVQPSLFPYVTMFLQNKQIKQITMGNRGSQASSLREGILSLVVVGCCFEPFFTDINEDQGSENVEHLMENIEEILRSNPTLNYTSTAWILTESGMNIQYDDIRYDEETHLRAGILTLDFKVHY